MKKFDVEITETLQRTVSVEAASQEEAEKIVTKAWNNVKANYRNSFMDLLILATAVTYKRYLYTKDKELQKLVTRYCNYDSGIDAANETTHIESSAIKNNGQDNKGFVNNKWRLIRS